MRLFVRFLFAIALFLTIFDGTHAWGQDATGAPPDSAPGIVLVGLKPGVPNEALTELAEKQAHHAMVDPVFMPDGSPEDIRIARLQVSIGSEPETIQALLSDPRVAFAEPDFRAWAVESAVLPNDPEFSRQWALNRIDAAGAWAIQTGQAGAVIAVVDSGIQLDHPDLANKLWTNPGEIPGNGLDDDGNGKVDDVHGWHFWHEWTASGYEPAEDANITDDFGHGTHVSGIAAATSNNAVGVAGVAWGPPVMTVKVLDQYGSGWYSDIYEGIHYAVDNGAKVINLSLGGSQASETLKSAVDYAAAHGVVVAAASGNDGGPVLYPAAFDSVLAVAATDYLDRRPSFSNFGSQLDLAAPGEEILSTWYLNNYRTSSGTSMATPHVSGVASLLLSQQPGLSPPQVGEILRESAEDIGAPGFDIYTGWGRLNAHRALVRVADIPDVYIRLEAPVTARYGELIELKITYGNRGGGPASDVQMRLDLPAGLTSQSGSTWAVGDLAPDSGPYTQIIPVKVSESGVLESRVEISTSGTETLLADNWDQVQVRVDYHFFLQLIFGR